MKNILFLFLFISYSFSLIAQQKSQYLLRSTTAYSGSSPSISLGDKTYLVQQSFGQSSPAGTIFDSEFVARQGFIQPHLLLKLSKETNELDLSVYPNPVIDRLQIKFDKPYEGKMYVTLYDNRGRLVDRKSYNEQQFIVLDVRQHSEGTYFLRVNQRNKQRVVQINKLR